mmetsp:Transcript_11746/g.16857  ORF Transcript_11746/g.16857 Transcript_11746/m.16857 type:complete len:691 (+) Transcript_11746:158-2230(+)|eukprot:CAMPEP_0201703484 /NCGR_PEP_ID=MMETSP0578-20130828/39867_1 /ASSEMBLY_ACC=CAM_ASM_000663 /TAXON_ID=267565 /ORGANISM="Skeletonema grethea, Strain CCMP 1804" /LENGTH=690 /DNA_ID=CAMNT_0048191279 /DNA_START=190 /DNA_END=2262 /DNA_ORIENTATION=-
MPTWEGIEDASTMLPRIWLSRLKETDIWKPLRKVDCKALNESRGEDVLIEGGRATAHPKEGTITWNFVTRPTVKLIPATWFMQTPNPKSKNKEFILEPLEEADSLQVELLYQNAVRASSSLGEGLDSILKEEVILESDPAQKVCVVRNGGSLAMKKLPKNRILFGIGEVQITLQRGYGQYTIEGEDDENALGDLTHVMFVIHGIGEAMWNKEEVATLSMRDEMDQLRMTVNKRKVMAWREECKKCERQKQPLPPLPNKVEFIPIMWFDKVRSPTHSLMSSLTSVTLRTVPALRSIANDVIFDVLMYLTPEFCEAILQCVTSEINDLYEKFQQVHPSFKARGGKFSLVGHSLGSVIAWDVLSIYKDITEKNAPKGSADDPICIDTPPSPPRAPSLETLDKTGIDNNPLAGFQGADESKHGTWGPTLPKKMSQTIPFEPDLTIFLGSPIGLFLTLRGAHSVFDEMRAIAEAERASLIPCDNEEADKIAWSPGGQSAPPPVFDLSPIICSPFSLPTKACFNVFHPSDPVAYRIEPLLLPEHVPNNDIPPPMFLSPDGKSLRLHVKARQVGDQLFRQIGSISNLFEATAQNAAAAAAQADAEAARRMAQMEAEKKNDSVPSSPLRPNFGGCIRDREVAFRLGGRSSRVDFQIQPGVIDNEYLSAVTAHSSYFINEDIIDFIICETRAGSKDSVE